MFVFPFLRSRNFKFYCRVSFALFIVGGSVGGIVPLNGSEAEMEKLPMLIGVIALTVVGEILRIISKRGREQDYPGIGRGVPSMFDAPAEEVVEE